MKSRIYNGSDPIVLSGPFAGMKYLNEIVWGPIEPKWLGTFEQELQSILDQILQTKYSTIIDVGSAEGYYAVGLAVKFPHAQVYSYDIDPWARRQQRKLARLNKAKNIKIGSRCTGKQLTDHISGRTLVFCDIEGSEYDLINLQNTPALQESDILVKLHDNVCSGFTTQSGAEELMRRFAATHEISTICLAPRSSSVLDPVLLTKLTPQEVAESMDEKRSQDQLWLWLKTRR